MFWFGRGGLSFYFHFKAVITLHRGLHRLTQTISLFKITSLKHRHAYGAQERTGTLSPGPQTFWRTTPAQERRSIGWTLPEAQILTVMAFTVWQIRLKGMMGNSQGHASKSILSESSLGECRSKRKRTTTLRRAYRFTKSALQYSLHCGTRPISFLTSMAGHIRLITRLLSYDGTLKRKRERGVA